MQQLRLVSRREVPLETMNLYPTMDSVTEAISFIEQQAPLSTPNEIFGALMLYHNTLLRQLSAEL